MRISLAKVLDRDVLLKFDMRFKRRTMKLLTSSYYSITVNVFKSLKENVLRMSKKT